MRKLLLALALALLPSLAQAQCNGVFQPGQACGIGSAQPAGIPHAVPVSAIISGLVAPVTISGANANAFDVGANGQTNPQLRVDTSVASVATGLLLQGQAAGSGMNLTALSSGTNEGLAINAKGSGNVTLGNVSTGLIVLGGGGGNVSIPLGQINTNAASNIGFAFFDSTGSVGRGLQVGSILASNTYSGLPSAGVINAQTGFQVNGAATAATFLRGNGTNFVQSSIGVNDVPQATTASYLSGSASPGFPLPSIIYTTETTTTFGATTTFDFSTFINTAVTLTANITTMTLSNIKAGQAGTITFIQDATGSRTTVWNTNFKFAGGVTPTLSTAANAVDVLAYSCRTTTFCIASLSKGVQ
jgi:hypothetical protein